MLAFRTLKGGKCKMKAILLAVKPNQLVKILNGEKTIEVRKSKLPLNIPVYLYCSKDKHLVLIVGNGESKLFYADNPNTAIVCGGELANGKVVARCVFSEVEEIACEKLDAGVGYNTIYYTETRDSHEELCELACLDISDLKFYLGEKDKGQIVGYAYHISNLEIFEEPKELSEFNRCDGFIDCCKCKYYPLSNNMGVNCKYRPLTKAPKSWCCVEEFK